MKTNFNATNCLHCLILSVINNSEISYFEMKCSIKKYYVVSQQQQNAILLDKVLKLAIVYYR